MLEIEKIGNHDDIYKIKCQNIFCKFKTFSIMFRYTINTQGFISYTYTFFPFERVCIFSSCNFNTFDCFVSLMYFTYTSCHFPIIKYCHITDFHHIDDLRETYCKVCFCTEIISIFLTCIRYGKLLSNMYRDFIFKRWVEFINTGFGSLEINKYLTIWINSSEVLCERFFIIFLAKMGAVDTINGNFIENTRVFFDRGYKRWTMCCDDIIFWSLFFVFFSDQ